MNTARLKGLRHTGVEDDEEVEDELGDLHRGQVLLPLLRVSDKRRRLALNSSK